MTAPAAGDAFRWSDEQWESIKRDILITTRLQMQVILENTAKFPLMSLSNDYYKLAYFLLGMQSSTVYHFQGGFLCFPHSVCTDNIYCS